jgi:hypothetical protein
VCVRACARECLYVCACVSDRVCGFVGVGV